MKKTLETDALDLLISAVQTYQEELQINKRVLINAANACDAAMGSGEIAKKYISQLYEALEKLEKTSGLASEVAEALLNNKRRALNVYYD
jgi:hypothetical protein